MKGSLTQKMSVSLRLPESKIRQIIQSAPHQYKTYPILKRNGQIRKIHHPSKRLKALQRWLVDVILNELPVHESAAAYRKGKSIRDNAEAHKTSNYLLRMDFSNFFESIKRNDVEEFLKNSTELSQADIDIFAQIVCRGNSLTIGAPSSPSLVNAMCFELDSRIASFCSSHGIKYTRYADDLFFSTTKPDILQGIPSAVKKTISTLPYPKGLYINADKTKHSSKKGSRRVTGLTLTPDGNVAVGRKLKRSVRARIHQFDSLDSKERKKLYGHITYIQSIDSNFINTLTIKYGSSLVAKALDFNAINK